MFRSRVETSLKMFQSLKVGCLSHFLDDLNFARISHIKRLTLDSTGWHNTSGVRFILRTFFTPYVSSDEHPKTEQGKKEPERLRRTRSGQLAAKGRSSSAMFTVFMQATPPKR